MWERSGGCNGGSKQADESMCGQRVSEGCLNFIDELEAGYRHEQHELEICTQGQEVKY